MQAEEYVKSLINRITLKIETAVLEIIADETTIIAQNIKADWQEKNNVLIRRANDYLEKAKREMAELQNPEDTLDPSYLSLFDQKEIAESVALFQGKVNKLEERSVALADLISKAEIITRELRENSLQEEEIK